MIFELLTIRILPITAVTVYQIQRKIGVLLWNSKVPRWRIAGYAARPQKSGTFQGKANVWNSISKEELWHLRNTHKAKKLPSLCTAMQGKFWQLRTLPKFLFWTNWLPFSYMTRTDPWCHPHKFGEDPSTGTWVIIFWILNFTYGRGDVHSPVSELVVKIWS